MRKSSKTLWLEQRYQSHGMTDEEFRLSVRRARAEQLFAQLVEQPGTFTSEDERDFIKLLAGEEL